MSIYDRKETPDPGEWKVDPKTGQRYRDIGHIREYEPTITINGLEIPQSQLADYHRRQKEAEERRKAEALEAAKNRPEPRSCPFITNGCSTACKREGCKIFTGEKCALAIIADATGVEIEETPAKDKRKCPFSIYGHCEGCALYNKGCGFVRIAKSYNN